MQQAKINGVVYSIPTTWADITIEQFQKFVKLGKEDDKLLAKRLNVLTGINIDIINGSSIEAISVLIDLMSELLYELPPQDLILTFEHKGETFTIHSNESLSFGQFVDWDTTIVKGNILDNLPLLIAIRSFNFNDKYEQTELLRRAELFKSLPVNIAYAYSNFFLNLQTNIDRLLKYCSMVEEQEQKEMERLKLLVQSGDGWERFTSWHKMTLLKLKRLQAKMLSRYYFSYPTKETN